MSVQREEEVAQLVREYAAESDAEGVGVHIKDLRLAAIPVPVNCPRHLLGPERDAAELEVGLAQPVIVEISAAARDDRSFRLRADEHGHRRFRIAVDGPREEEPAAQVDLALGEEARRFFEGAVDERRRHGWGHVDGHFHRERGLEDARSEEKAGLHGATL